MPLLNAASLSSYRQSEKKNTTIKEQNKSNIYILVIDFSIRIKHSL
jgi:hypothetical protein